MHESIWKFYKTKKLCCALVRLHRLRREEGEVVRATIFNQGIPLGVVRKKEKAQTSVLRIHHTGMQPVFVSSISRGCHLLAEKYLKSERNYGTW